VWTSNSRGNNSAKINKSSRQSTSASIFMQMKMNMKNLEHGFCSQHGKLSHQWNRFPKKGISLRNILQLWGFSYFSIHELRSALKSNVVSCFSWSFYFSSYNDVFRLGIGCLQTLVSCGGCCETIGILKKKWGSWVSLLCVTVRNFC
jgi:hypothetical protein